MRRPLRYRCTGCGRPSPYVVCGPCWSGAPNEIKLALKEHEALIRAAQAEGDDIADFLIYSWRITMTFAGILGAEARFQIKTGNWK